MSIILGLTGSIGMGKSTTARMFADRGLPVWDADAAVHRLYAPGQPAALAVGALFPGVMEADGSVSRPRLRALIAQDPTVMDRLNAAVHPLVAIDRAAFIRGHPGADIIVVDVPLLFETGGDAECDYTVVVSASLTDQRARVLARGMTEAEFQTILARQTPDAEKRGRADYVIETTSLDTARAGVDDVLADIRRQRTAHA